MSYSNGSKKALAAMRKLYGKAEGLRIFKAKADEQGRGKNITVRANSIYSKGASIPKSKRKR